MHPTLLGCLNRTSAPTLHVRVCTCVCVCALACVLRACYLQGLLSRAARLLLELPGLEGLDVLVTLPVAGVQQVLLGLQQALARGHVADPDGEAPVGWSGIKRRI